MSSWPTSCPAPLSKHTGKEFNFRSMLKIWEASQHIIIITILMYAEIIVCTINQLFIYSSRSTGISYGSCEKGPLDCEDTLSNISKTSEGYLKVFVVSTNADARSNAVYNNQKQIGIYKTQMRWLIYIFTSIFEVKNNLQWRYSEKITFFWRYNRFRFSLRCRRHFETDSSVRDQHKLTVV